MLPRRWPLVPVLACSLDALVTASVAEESLLAAAADGDCAVEDCGVHLLQRSASRKTLASEMTSALSGDAEMQARTPSGASAPAEVPQTKKLTPNETATVYFCTLGLLAVASFVQHRRYAGEKDEQAEAEDTTQKVKRLAQRSSSMALAVVTDANIKLRHRENVSLAVRVGVFALFAALPTLNTQLRIWFLDMRYDIGYTCVLLVWTVDRSVGSTLANVCDALWGTIIAWIFMFFAMGIYPDGYHIGDPPSVWWFGLIYLVITVLFMMYGTFRNGVRIWCLSYHVVNMMYFLKPTRRDSLCPYSTHFRLDTSGLAFGYILVTLCAGVLALAAVSLPDPKMSQRLALSRLLASQREISAILNSVLDIHLGESEDADVTLARSHSFVSHIEGDIESLQRDIELSWWETFDFGHHLQIRERKKQHTDVVKMLLSMIHTMHPWDLSVMAEMSKEQHKLVGQLKVEVQTLCSTTLQLLEICTLAIVDGVVSAEETAELDDSIRTVEKASAGLAATFPKDANFLELHTKHKLGIEFLFLLSCFSRVVVNHAEKLKKNETIKKRWYFLEWLQLRGTWERFVDPAHQEFAFRNSISLFLCIIVGYAGIGRLVRPYSSYIASNASLLLSTAVGSALKKNTGRVQGLVLGISIGEMLYGFIQQSSNCFDPPQWQLGAVITFIFAAGTFFLYQSSTEFSYVFYLMSGFGCMKILKQCDSHPESEHAASAFTAILKAVICVTILAAVDLSLCQSANIMASAAAIDFMERLRKVWNGTLRDVYPDVQETDELLSVLSSMSSKASDAAMEPTVAALPFNTAMFDKIHFFGKHLRNTILVYHWATRHESQSTDGGEISEVLEKGDKHVYEVLKNCQSLKTVEEMYNQMMDEMTVFIDAKVKSRSLKESIRTGSETRLEADDILKSVADLCGEVAEVIPGCKEADSTPTLESNTQVCLHVVLLQLHKFAVHVNSMKTAVKITA